MKQIDLSVDEYAQDLKNRFGFADETLLRKHAIARAERNGKLGKANSGHVKSIVKRRIQQPDFNPFTNDPNCKTCGKKD